MYKLRTVDVWDTLLRRDCHPEFIKLATARHLLLACFEALKPEYRDQWSLYRARLGAERRLGEAACAAGDDDEYEISAVFEAWLRDVQADPLHEAWIKRLEAYEFQLEMDRSFADADIVEFLAAHPAEHTIFLSDFYMDSSRLRQLLAARGLEKLAYDGIASCEVGVNKRSGRLYQHVHSKYGVAPAQHVHVGDNAVTDVEAARRLGVTAIQYVPSAHHAERLARESLFASRHALIAEAMHACRSSVGSGTPAVAFRLGAEASPLFVGFMLWIAERALIERLDCLMFVGPGASYLGEIYAALFPQGRHFGHHLPSVIPSATAVETDPSVLQQTCKEGQLGLVSLSGSEAPMHALQAGWAAFKPRNLYLVGDRTDPLRKQTTDQGYLEDFRKSHARTGLSDLLDATHPTCRADTVLDKRTAKQFETVERAGQAVSPRFRAGLLEAVERWRPLLESGVLSSSELRATASRIWIELRELDVSAGLPAHLVGEDPFGLTKQSHRMQQSAITLPRLWKSVWRRLVNAIRPVMRSATSVSHRIKL